MDAVNSKWLLPPTWQECIPGWIAEDCPSFDYAAMVVGDGIITALIRAKSPGVLCGRPFVDGVFGYLNCSIEWLLPEGSVIQTTPLEVCRVTGPAYRVLQGERIALNLLSRASGIASITRTCVDRARKINPEVCVAGTRKTTPGFRFVEKYALIVGGADSHRFDTSQQVMLKDNHVDLAGSVNAAMHALPKQWSAKVEVECRDGWEAREALAAGAHSVMLDNVGLDVVTKEVEFILAAYPAAHIELSGGLNPENIADYAAVPGVSLLSLGCLTNGHPAVDFSLSVILPSQ